MLLPVALVSRLLSIVTGSSLPAVSAATSVILAYKQSGFCLLGLTQLSAHLKHVSGAQLSAQAKHLRSNQR